MELGMIADTLRSSVRQKNIPGLDAMRAVAIVLVVAFHFQLPVGSALGVIVFFVLSGFLITGILIKEIAISGTVSLRTFYIRRAYRIFPAFYVCWIITMGVALWRHDHITRSNAIATFFYFADYARAILPLQQQSIYTMAISWSLAVEEQFYLLWPLVLLWVCRLKSPIRAVAWIICGLWAWRALLVIGFHVPWDYAYNAFDTRADALMIGCWLALLLHRDQKLPRPILLWLSSRWLVLIPLVTLSIITSLDAHSKLNVSQQVLEFSLDPVLTAALLLQWMYWGSMGWVLLEHPLIKFIARISYSLYLYHQVVHLFFGQMLHAFPIARGGTVLNIAFAVLVASASYYGIERPFIKIRDRGRRTSVLMDDGLQHPG